jgi:hypothetical protein
LWSVATHKEISLDELRKAGEVFSKDRIVESNFQD